MNAPKKIWYSFEYEKRIIAGENEEDIPYIRADLVLGLVKIMEDFPGFTEDAAVGDAWVESLWAALKALEEIDGN